MSRKITPKAHVRQPAKQRRLALALLAGAISAAAHPALAQQIPASVRADERVSFSIAAQPLSSALSDYARQAGVNALWGDHAPADAALAAPDEPTPALYEPARPSPLETEADTARTSSILFSHQDGGAAPASAQSFNETGRRAAFLNGQRGRDEGVLDASYVPPRSPYTIQAGATISAALITALNSDQPGRVIAQVSENVFDSVTGETLLIPQGARLIGSYDSDTAYGERRLLVVWNRLIMPNGWSIPLRGMPGADAAGSAGLTGEVDAHIGRIAVASLISAVLGVAANESEDEDDARLSQSIGDAAAQQAAQTGSRLIDRELNVRPTLRIRAGARVRVLVSQDVQLRPYPP